MTKMTRINARTARKRYESGERIGVGHDSTLADPSYTGFTRESVGDWSWPELVDNSNDRGRRLYWWAPAEQTELGEM